MRKAAAVVVIGALLIVGHAAASGLGQPRLAFTSETPAVVNGRGFQPYERVRLLVSRGPTVGSVRAGRLGRFRFALRFPMPRCGGLVVQALGSRGSRAMIDRSGPDCTAID